MIATTVTTEIEGRKLHRFDPKVFAAFFAIYVLWGTTFLAIRIAVRDIPPLLAAGVRFFAAGALLYSFTRMKGNPRPSAVEWRSLSFMAVLMFVGVYGPVFWAEQYVTSGVTSLLQATIPLVTIVLEMVIFRRQPFRWGAVGACVLGFCGVGALLLPDQTLNVPLVPSLAILGAATSWSLGSVFSQSMELPKSKPLIAGAAMLLGGGALLALSLLTAEWRLLSHVSLRAALAVLYLIVCGSLVGFTAFVWLLGRMPATRVASHAYVNPIVAVALGYFAAAEAITARMLLGAGIILMSVFLILRRQAEAPPLSADEP